MSQQVAHRVTCPVCGGWAQLRIAYPFTDARCDEPVVVMFSCINQTEAGHWWPAFAELMKLIPERDPS
jgi:hypothetical protein